jgi:hypothetical protein
MISVYLNYKRTNHHSIILNFIIQSCSTMWGYELVSIIVGPGANLFLFSVIHGKLIVFQGSLWSSLMFLVAPFWSVVLASFVAI